MWEDKISGKRVQIPGDWERSLVMEKQFTEATGLQGSAEESTFSTFSIFSTFATGSCSQGKGRVPWVGQKHLRMVLFKIIPKVFKGNIIPTKKW